MLLFTQFSNPRTACYALESVGETKMGRLTPRPWNMHEPDTTAWWLVSSSDWPAFKHGKFFLEWNNGDKDSIFLSLHIEKGLDPSVSSVYSCARGLRQIIQHDWMWFRLIRDLETYQLQETVTQFADKLPVPLELRIRAEYVPDPCDFDPYSPKYEQDEQLNRDEYRFELDIASNQFVLTHSQTPTDTLNELSQLKSFADLAPILRLLTSNAWAWIDYNMGISFRVRKEGSSNQAFRVWSASDLWANILSYLSVWLV